MGSPERLFGRKRTLHEILGGGLVADVILWRQKDVTMRIMLVALAAWVVFEKSGYTLLSLVSSVLLLLFVVLFLWAKSAAILNRPAPPLPELQLSEEMVNEAAAIIRTRVNALLLVSLDISLGKDSRLFFKVAAYPLLIYFVGGLTDFLTLSYTSLVIVLTIPAFYERCEDYVDKYVMMGYRRLLQLYVKLDEEYVNRFQHLVLEKKKLS
ncbi:PREDICTED: reticulon-like protein B12 isoform X1 [Fragaria vesca subsp. vesca]|uniref:reticulon-like protein B12 isoform X1 n=1 Tax=Fragaria vesca subsp. vesca TaxID=101020 RepID=UPI0002C32C89|nr:PREDICTED: reticulon-like protein B12 isoform X1 [Fragaria vesca subsp. vesca]